MNDILQAIAFYPEMIKTFLTWAFQTYVFMFIAYSFVTEIVKSYRENIGIAFADRLTIIPWEALLNTFENLQSIKGCNSIIGFAFFIARMLLGCVYLIPFGIVVAIFCFLMSLLKK